MGWDYYLIELLSAPVNTVYAAIPVAFLFGAMVGSLLNVCILRMPSGRSMWWPSSRCGTCYQSIPGWHNLPLLSYLLLRGRCRACGARFSSRYFWIEFLTAASFAALFWLEVAGDVRGVSRPAPGWGAYLAPMKLVPIWAYHAVLLGCLIVAAFTELSSRVVPRGITTFGMVIGVAGGTLAPWPWPLDEAFLHPLDYTAALQAAEVSRTQLLLPAGVGLQARPVGSVLPSWLGPHTLQLGLANSLAGVAMGFVLGRSLQRLGGMSSAGAVFKGDQTNLVMMIGAFVGWQSLLLALGFALVLWLVPLTIGRLRGERNLPASSPSLACGAMLSVLTIGWLTTQLRHLWP